MDAAIAGLLLVTSALAGSAVPRTLDHRALQATTLTLREAAARPNIRDAAPVVVRLAQTRRPRFSKIERAIAIGAGTVIGFYTGAVVGWHATANHSNPNDDTSGLKGVVIGAPIGAAVGAVLATVLTR